MDKLKYETLVNILDQIRKEAPPEFKRYHVLETDIEQLNNARSRAFIHLFLKVRFGLLHFKEREYFITDGAGDGGIDAYFINKESHVICIIQSKFRTTYNNFKEKNILLNELLQMDVARITEGNECNEEEEPYNGKIKQMQRDINNVPDIGRYKYEIVILANLRDQKPNSLRKLTGGFSTYVFDYEKTYSELLFPVVSGTYYKEKELCITLNLSNTTISSSRISYNVTTFFKPCDISLVFVPTIEIGNILYRYKNSILKYNPRSFLELANNTVNREISKTITERNTNEFALFNNGITMLSEDTKFNERVGVRDQAQVIVTNPQIINGGQTAYTLSRLYEHTLRGTLDKAIFDNKEVLVKIITFYIDPNDDQSQQLTLIEEISKATNQQTPVDEADRRSNDKIQIQLQRMLFNEYGFYYERKRGEFADGIREKYINRSQLIDRDIFLRIGMACDFRPSMARRCSSKVLFREDNFSKTLSDVNRVHEYFFAYQCYLALNNLEKKFYLQPNNPFGMLNYGQALRYGKYAVISVCNAISKDKLPYNAGNLVNEVLSKWLNFESFANSLSSNYPYFSVYIDPSTEEQHKQLEYAGYYKGKTLDQNLRRFFFPNNK